MAARDDARVAQLAGQSREGHVVYEDAVAVEGVGGKHDESGLVHPPERLDYVSAPQETGDRDALAEVPVPHLDHLDPGSGRSLEGGSPFTQEGSHGGAGHHMQAPAGKRG